MCNQWCRRMLSLQDEAQVHEESRRARLIFEGPCPEVYQFQVTAHDIGTLDQGLKQWVSVVRTGVIPNFAFGIVPEQQPCEVLGWVVETVQELK